MISEKYRKKWNSLSRVNKVIIASRYVLSIVVLILCVLGLTGVYNITLTNNIVMPIMGIVFFLQGLFVYKRNKPQAIVSFGMTFFIIITTVFVYSLYFRH